jgi:hypothetical protein
MQNVLGQLEHPIKLLRPAELNPVRVLLSRCQPVSVLAVEVVSVAAKVKQAAARQRAAVVQEAVAGDAIMRALIAAAAGLGLRDKKGRRAAVRFRFPADASYCDCCSAPDMLPATN